MINKRIYQLLLCFVMTAILCSALCFTSMGDYPAPNKVSLLCILIALGCLWIIPCLLVAFKSKKHFSKSISSMLFTVFQIVFWTNLGLIVIPVPAKSVRIFINLGLLVICILCTLVIIRYELKPKAGKPDKKEIRNIQKALLELEIAGSIMPECSGDEIMEIKETMNSLIDGQFSMIHGIDANILNECKTIRNSALCKDADSVRFHTSFLGQLLVLAKQ